MAKAKNVNKPVSKKEKASSVEAKESQVVNEVSNEIVNEVSNEVPTQVTNDEKDDIISNLQAELEEMKKAMKTMLSQKATEKVEKVVVKEDEIEIGTYFIQGVGFTSRDESIQISMKANEIQSLSISEMKKLLRQSEIRALFENGTCYFVNEEDYEALGVHRKNDLSTENLQEILYSKDFNHIVDVFNQMTTYKKDASVIHCLIYRITDLIRKGELASLDYNTRIGIADYFGLSGFERGIKTLNDLDNFRG